MIAALLARTAPAALREYPDVRAWPDGPMRRGRCYWNAADVCAASDGGLRVVAGWAAGPGGRGPVEHAWIVDGGGVGYEVTWPAPGSEYRGRVLPPDGVH